MARTETWFWDGIVFLALLTVLLILLELCVVRIDGHTRAIRTLRHAPLSLTLRQSAPEDDVVRVRASLDRLPQVHVLRMDADAIGVALRSPDDARTLLYFLERPDARAIFSADIAPNILRQMAAIESRARGHHADRLRLFGLGSMYVLSIALVLVQFVRTRRRLCTTRLRLARLSGADLWRIVRPFVLEAFLLLFLSLLLSFPFVVLLSLA